MENEGNDENEGMKSMTPPFLVLHFSLYKIVINMANIFFLFLVLYKITNIIVLL